MTLLMNWTELWTLCSITRPLHTHSVCFCFSVVIVHVSLVYLHESDLHRCLCKNVSVWFGSVSHVWRHMEAVLVLVQCSWNERATADDGSDSQCISPEDRFMLSLQTESNKSSNYVYLKDAAGHLVWAVQSKHCCNLDNRVTLHEYQKKKYED